ncbi:reverse transcriptase domain-containing protein [Tanacetum coccineum]|uniref:Reverse transcriptase domain-containing protein n=1 Tax=Tanacetum coccineum TaxID=301880 RepID=A0ABQ5H4J4_9ASTR
MRTVLKTATVNVIKAKRYCSTISFRRPFLLDTPLVSMAVKRTMDLIAPSTQRGSARIWLEKEPPRSILTWDDLVSKFINQLFPPSKTTNLRNEITRFQQRFDESFYEAWDRFNDLLRACPHHGFSELHQLDTFYNALNANDQDSLNSATGGNFLDKMPRECLRIIESKSKVRNSRNKAVIAKVSSNSSTPGISPDVAALTTEVSELKNLMKTMLIDKQKAQALGNIDEDVENKNSNVSNSDEPVLLNTPLSNKVESFNPEDDIDEIDAFLAMEVSSNFEEDYFDSEGDVIFLENLLSDDTTHNLAPEVISDHEALHNTSITFSPRNDPLHHEFAGELITLPSSIVHEHEDYLSRMTLLCEISISRSQENVHANQSSIIESLPVSLIPVEDSVENDDSEDEHNELPNLDHQDNPSSPRPPPEPPDVCLNFKLDTAMNDEDFNQGEIVLSLNVEDVNSFIFVIWTFSPFFTYPRILPVILSLRSEDLVFDPGISTFHFSLKPVPFASLDNDYRDRVIAMCTRLQKQKRFVGGTL